jgi:thiamine biosynthesis lipoprotein
VVALPLVAGSGSPADDGRVRREVGVMGTSLTVEVRAADRAAGLTAAEAAVRAVEAAEERLSTWRRGGELDRLNRASAGEGVRLSPALARDLAAAAACWRATGGAFDPSVGPLVAAWGLREGGRLPAPAEREAARAATGLDGLALAAGTARRLRPDLVLDEGGFGKGAALADAAAALAGLPGTASAVLSLGGQVLVLGGEAAVPLADPRRRGEAALGLALDGGSLATSGNAERGIVAGGARRGHLLDPRRGEPAPDFGSLSVWAADPLAADCLSTGLYVLGADGALAWAARHRGVEALALETRGGRLVARATEGLARRVRWRAPGLEMEVFAVEPRRAASGPPDGDDRAAVPLPQELTTDRPAEPRITTEVVRDPEDSIDERLCELGR